MINVQTYRGITLSEEWAKEVIIQLNKDMEMAGVSQAFDINLPFTEFAQQLVLFLEYLLAHDDTQLYNLLYRIDVNQNDIYDGEGKPQELLAELIIMREFQKIVLRSQFGK